MNDFTDAPSIKPDHATLNVTWTVLIQIRLNCVFFEGCIPPPRPFVLWPAFKYKALIAGVLSSSIWVLYQGRTFLAAMERKNITDLFCFERAHYKVFIFCAFFHGACKPATILTYLKPETSGDWTHKIWQDGTFFHYPFFVLNIPFCLFYLLSLIGIMFPLFVSFDIVWQLATTHATGTQIVRAKMTSLDAISCRGNKSSSRSLARFCRTKQKIYRSRLALVKTIGLDLYLSLHNGQRRESCGKVVTYGKVYPG